MYDFVGDGSALKHIELGSNGFTYVFRHWTFLGVGSNSISPWGGASIIGEGVIIIKWTNNDKGLKDYNPFFWSFSLSYRKDFLDEIFCNLLLKIHIISSIHHNFVLTFDE